MPRSTCLPWWLPRLEVALRAAPGGPEGALRDRVGGLCSLSCAT